MGGHGPHDVDGDVKARVNDDGRLSDLLDEQGAARPLADGQCVLVIIGVKPDGEKERVTLSDGYRESKASWVDLLLDLKARGLQAPRLLAVGDGAMGLWAVFDQVFPQTRQQRCWFLKIGNVLNAMPKSQHGKAKAALAEIWNAATRADAIVAFNRFVDTYTAKYPKAVEKLTKDRDALLAFYDLPAGHWQHVRTTNPIESTFATVRHRTGRTRNSPPPSLAPSLRRVHKIRQ